MPSTSAPPPVGHYENFPVASLLCPPALRAPIAAIYHFARTADDIADEGNASAALRLDTLAAYRRQLLLAVQAAQDLQAGPAPVYDPRWERVFVPLQAALLQYQLPPTLLHDLLDAFVQDVVMTRDAASYATESALLDYCRRSANPVGRLLLHLYGVAEPLALQQSDAICTALQLINFWQDPSVDIPRGRHYFSDEACARHGVSRASLQTLQASAASRRLVADCAASARTLMLRGAPLVHRLPGRAGWELRLVVQGGLRILDKIAQCGYATLQQRPVLGRSDYIRMIFRALRM